MEVYIMRSNEKKLHWGTLVAVTAALILTLNLAGTFRKLNVVYAIEQSSIKPQVEVPVDLEAEEGAQKNVDAGHSPWKLDPAFVAQVFVSLKISPEGIQGEYPIKYEELKIVQNTGKEAVIDVSGSNTPIKRVYLKHLVRQDNTGIWTVVGYDPIK
jgi:hypothetical protein